MTNLYTHNPLIHADRRRDNDASAWARNFSCADMKPLIVCRGPIRKEAIDVFKEMGMTQVGVLLSQKDSIVYAHALAPELRQLPCEHVHQVPDYTGATKEERKLRVQQIIEIARTHGYDSVFAGYGFMAEDEDFVRTIEEAGLIFIGPCSGTVRSAGRKDEAKRTALAEKVSVTPGVDDVTSRLLLSKHGTTTALEALTKEHNLVVADDLFSSDYPAELVADAVLNASYSKGIDLYSIDELVEFIGAQVAQLLTDHPGHRIRLKAIGGGGGKGQRILSGAAKEGAGTLQERAKAAAAVAPEKAREVLAEVKATGVGDNKNILLELNIEQTRHNEIQLLGNGQWCVALGGRDCSLQMHEQKLLEVSVTQSSLQNALLAARKSGRTREAEVLEADLGVLCSMETEGARFGQAVKLDSASTFECIVEGDQHYFMEVNTRIQVEHRVTELCARLRFKNPQDKTQYFDVESLVESMALLAKHKTDLPKPELHSRFGAGLEARLNATDDSLSPHAGGAIISWSDPVEHEIRDDQGICVKNPDTGTFVRYTLAGAYDSNVALLVTCGEDRVQAYDRLAEILRVNKLRGFDLATNLAFHYGLVNWFRGHTVMAKPTTGFVVPYLTQVGLLRAQANEIDVVHAFGKVIRSECARDKATAKAAQGILLQKQTLLKRPIDAFLGSPHVLSGWLSTNRRSFELQDNKLVWLRNPLEVLNDAYQFLNMERRDGAPPAQVIWDNDADLIDCGLAFYDALQAKLGMSDFVQLQTALQAEAPAKGFDAEIWQQVKNANQGHQLGLSILSILPLIGYESGFFDMFVDDNLDCVIPERLLDVKLQAEMKKVLAPPPATAADEIVAVTGGMFYAQEAPGKPPLIAEGEHFVKGQTLYIIEVMKMFNRVPAPFAGTIDEIVMQESDGSIVSKGQTLFKVTPDERIVIEDPDDITARRHKLTDGYVARL